MLTCGHRYALHVCLLIACPAARYVNYWEMQVNQEDLITEECTYLIKGGGARGTRENWRERERERKKERERISLPLS
jgi:hypothetical protein